MPETHTIKMVHKTIPPRKVGGLKQFKHKGSCSCGQWETDYLDSTSMIYQGWDLHREQVA